MINYDPEKLHQDIMSKMEQKLSYKGGDLLSWQKELKAKVWELLGLDQMPTDRPDLNVRSLWKCDHALGTIEKLVFTSEPGYHVPAYLCLPRDQSRENAEGKLPFFVCIQGHSTGMHNSIALTFDESEVMKVEGDRDFGLGCMARGIGAICIEQRDFGECEDQNHGNATRCHNPVERALMLGRTLMGERTHDADRAVDYLMTRKDVDLSRIGVMGNSGGGSVSFFAGALLDRITHVMPSCDWGGGTPILCPGSLG